MHSPYWFEVAVIFIISAVGSVIMGHWEERTPKWRRLLKPFLLAGVSVLVSATFGRVYFFVFLCVLATLVAFIHVWWLPKKGINGWTAEPREKYYAMRGWKLPDSGSK